MLCIGAIDNAESWRLVLLSLAGMLGLLFLVIRLKLHAMVALLLVSLLIGLGAGMNPNEVLQSISKGMGGTLGGIALLVGLGSMFGQMLEVSGGARRVSQSMMKLLGESRAQWALGITGFIVAIPVFFDVGFIILMPLVYGLVNRTGRPIAYYGIPLLAGLAVTHSFVPPTPGPIAVAQLLHADLGWVIFLGIVVGFPSMVVAGPIYGAWISRYVTTGNPKLYELTSPAPGLSAEQEGLEALPAPGFALVAGLILVPLILILGKTVSGAVGSADHVVVKVFGLIGEPVVALLIVTLLCFRVLGTARGYTRQQVQDIAGRSLEPAGIILLVTGAGGVLKQVLVDSKAGTVLAETLSQSGAPLILLAFALAGAMRLMQGSATVSMMTAGGLLASMLEHIDVSTPQRALLVVAIGAGATLGSHVNDSGFWLVSRYMGFTVPDTLRTWTACTVIIALVSLCLVALLWPLLPAA